MTNIFLGVPRRPDEIASAHIYQSSMATQLPLMIVFLARRERTGGHSTALEPRSLQLPPQAFPCGSRVISPLPMSAFDPKRTLTTSISGALMRSAQEGAW